MDGQTKRLGSRPYQLRHVCAGERCATFFRVRPSLDVRVQVSVSPIPSVHSDAASAFCFPLDQEGIRTMELSAPGRRRGSKNYTQEVRETVVAQADDPGRSIAEVAQEHGLKAYMVAKWRRERARSQATALLPAAESFLPVQMARSPKQQPASIVERGAVRVRFKAHPISTCCGRPG
jgi:transposase